MPCGRPMTVVFSAISSATPRTMNEVPSVTMKAGTFSLAMITPLMKPTSPAPATAARKPMTAAGNSGTPALKAARSASADSTEARLITQPTERSIPAPMMTKVCPSPSSTIGVIATRMFCELRMVRKLTDPPLASGTAITKNRIIRPRNAQAQSRLKVSRNRCHTVRLAAALRSTALTRSLPSGGVAGSARGRSRDARLPSAQLPGTW